RAPIKYSQKARLIPPAPKGGAFRRFSVRTIGNTFSASAPAAPNLLRGTEPDLPLYLERATESNQTLSARSSPGYSHPLFSTRHSSPGSSPCGIDVAPFNKAPLFL